MFLVNIILVLICLNGAKSKILPSKGPCFTLESCPTLNSLVQTRKNDFGTRILLNALYCYKRNDESYLKCPTKEQLDRFIGKTELLPLQEDCGSQSVTGLIAGGEEARLREFPWLALITYQKPPGQPRYGCTGNLISKRYILTAAHCLEQHRIDKLGPIHKVVLGEYHINNETDCFDNDCTHGVREYSVENYYIHPAYNPHVYQADIGLIRLDQDVHMTEFIQPICLPAGALYLDSTEKLWIGGWGINKNSTFNEVKQKAAFTKLEDSACTRRSRRVPNENQICVTAVNYAKTCAGDSGGPLVATRRISGHYQYYLAGVLSIGSPCSLEDRFSFYTRVSDFLRWIMEKIY